MEGSRGGDGERRKKEVHRREEKKGRTNAGGSVPQKKVTIYFLFGSDHRKWVWSMHWFTPRPVNNQQGPIHQQEKKIYWF